MLTFLFWNLNKNLLAATVGKLVKQNGIDIVILAESAIPDEVILPALHNSAGVGFSRPYSACEKLVIYTRLPRNCFSVVTESARTTIQNLSLPLRPELLLAAVHLPSQLHSTRESLAMECGQFADDLREAEARVGHSRTILVGDFNLNPFDAGLVGAAATNAVMTRGIAQRGSRTVQRRRFGFFYNPMWAHFGDGDPGPPGTYYYESSEHVAYFWHIFDQVMFRPELMNYFENENLKILTSDGDTTFLTPEGIPDRSRVSDHLPILFRLNL